MLFIKNNWDVFEYALAELFDSVLLNTHTLEVNITFYLFEIALLLKLFRPALIKQIRKHQLYFHKELNFRWLPLL
jgi:hypothetical protein